MHAVVERVPADVRLRVRLPLRRAVTKSCAVTSTSVNGSPNMTPSFSVKVHVSPSSETSAGGRQVRAGARCRPRRPACRCRTAACEPSSSAGTPTRRSSTPLRVEAVEEVSQLGHRTAALRVPPRGLAPVSPVAPLALRPRRRRHTRRRRRQDGDERDNFSVPLQRTLFVSFTVPYDVPRALPAVSFVPISALTGYGQAGLGIEGVRRPSPTRLKPGSSGTGTAPGTASSSRRYR